MKHTTDWASWIALAALTVIWGSAFALTEVALTGVPSAGVAFARAALAAIVIVPAAFAFGSGLPRTWGEWAWSVAVGFLSLALPFSLIAWAQRALDSSVTGVLIATVPLFVLLLARVVLKERIRPRQWIGFALGCSGIAALSGGVSLSPGGVLPALAVVLAALCYAASSIVVKRMPPLHPFTATAAALMAACVMLAPAGAGPVTRAIPEAPFAALAALGVLGLVQTGAAQIIRYGATRRAGPVFMSSVSYIIPVWAGVIGVVLLDEPLTLPALTGFALVMTGLFVARITPQTTAAPRSSAG